MKEACVLPSLLAVPRAVSAEGRDSYSVAANFKIKRFVYQLPLTMANPAWRRSL